MILFLGTRPGKPIKQILTNVSCPHCGQHDTLTLVTQDQYFHLFWIKLFKISTQRFAQCSHCKAVFYEQEFSEEMKKAI